jgi:hypothetical protein
MVEDDAIDLGNETGVGSQQEAMPVQEEKMLPASRVQELIKKAKLKGRDDMMEQLEELRQENERLRSSGQPSMGGMAPQVDADALRKQVLEDLRAQMQSEKESQAQEQLRQEAEKLAADYHTKMKSGAESFSDFNDIMADFDPSAFPQLVYLANSTDNTAAVMYELAKNPSKLATAAVLAERDPRAAQNMINKLSASIRANEEAKAQEAKAQVNAPLNRLQPSPVGQDSRSVHDYQVRDFKKMFRG